MGFLDKAKQAAMDLQQKADTALGNAGMMGGSPLGGPAGAASGGADRLLHDLGVLTYLNATGRPGSAEDYNRIMGALQQLHQQGQLNLSLTPATGAPGGPPPPPGAVRAHHEATQAGQGTPAGPPPPGGGSAPPASGPAADSSTQAEVADSSTPPEVSQGESGDAPTATPPTPGPEHQSGGGTPPPPPPPSWAQ